MKKTKKSLIIGLVPFTLLILYFLVEWLFYPGGLKRIYYFHYKYDKDTIRIVEDKDFPYNVEGYSQIYTLNSSYYVPHRILLIPESKSVPLHYEFCGEILVEIYDKNNNLVYSFTAAKPFNIHRKEKEDYYGNYLIYGKRQFRNATSIFAFELGEIPFSIIRLRWDRLKNMQIRITVLKSDENLQKYCDSVTLVIIPSLSYG